jgi:DNA invertase Pin-like site-specific DNA recombinase
MTVGIYVRVSTEEQAREGYSISAQRKSLEAYCVSQGWERYEFYADMGVSAKNTDRPQLQKLMTDIKKGKINTVLVYRLDRFTRSVLDLYKMLEILEKYDCTFKSATEMYDTSSAMGRLFITLVAAMAQWERENLGERVRMGKLEKFQQGGYSALAPYGFDKSDDKLKINEEQATVLLDMIDKVEKGWSARQIADYLNESKYKPVRSLKWQSTTILDMMKNPVLYGATRWNDELKEGTHEGIITKERHERIVKILKDRRNHKKRKVNSLFVYQMKLICPTCKNHLTSERFHYTNKDGTLRQHSRYRCQVCAREKRKAVSVSEKIIEKAFLEYIKSIELNGIYESKEEKDKVELLEREIESIEEKREKFQKGWANGWIKDDEFSNLMKETETELERLRKERDEHAPDNDRVDKETVLAYAKSISKNFNFLTTKEKRDFINISVRSIYFDYEDNTVVGKNGKPKLDRTYNVTGVDFY